MSCDMGRWAEQMQPPPPPSLPPSLPPSAPPPPVALLWLAPGALFPLCMVWLFSVCGGVRPFLATGFSFPLTVCCLPSLAPMQRCGIGYHAHLLGPDLYGGW